MENTCQRVMDIELRGINKADGIIQGVADYNHRSVVVVAQRGFSRSVRVARPGTGPSFHSVPSL